MNNSVSIKPITLKNWQETFDALSSSPLSNEERQWIKDALVRHPEWAKFNHYYPLQVASEFGDAELVRVLLPLSDAKAYKSIAFRTAAQNGHEECVRLLLPASDVNAEEGEALRHAARNGHDAIVQLLLPHIDWSICDSSALLLAVHHGRTSTVQLLLPYFDPKANDSELLHTALQYQQWPLAKQFLPLSDIAAKNHRALKLAVQAENMEMALLIFQSYSREEQAERLLMLSEYPSTALKFGPLQAWFDRQALEAKALSDENVPVACKKQRL